MGDRPVAVHYHPYPFPDWRVFPVLDFLAAVVRALWVSVEPSSENRDVLVGIETVRLTRAHITVRPRNPNYLGPA